MSAAVYTEYPPNNPPPHPGPEWTRFICIADTHSRVFPVPPGDVLLHAGDLSSWGTHKQLRKTIDWLISLPHELKIIIAGNHDLSLDVKWRGTGGMLNIGKLDPQEVDDSLELVRSQPVLEAGIRYLNREILKFRTKRGQEWKIYGSPAAPRFSTGAFQYRRGVGGEAEWAKIPKDIDILMTHTPPVETLDVARGGRSAGCQDLKERLQDLRLCRLHVFGHIHENHGALLRKKKDGCVDIDYVSVNAAMKHGGQAVIVDLKKDADSVGGSAAEINN